MALSVERIRELQKDGPWVAIGLDGSVRSIEPAGRLRDGESVFQVLGAKGLKACKAALTAAKRWECMDEEQREALLEADVETYGRLRLAAKRVRGVSREEFYSG